MSLSIIYENFRNITSQDFHYKQEESLSFIEENLFNDEEIEDVKAYKKQWKQEKKEFKKLLSQKSYDPENMGIRQTHDQAINQIIINFWLENKIEELVNPDLCNQQERFIGAFYNKRTLQITIMFLSTFNPEAPQLILQKLGTTSKKVLEATLRESIALFEEKTCAFDRQGISYIRNTRVEFNCSDVSELSVYTSMEVEGSIFAIEEFHHATSKTKIIKDIFSRIHKEKEVIKAVLDCNFILTAGEVMDHSKDSNLIQQFEKMKYLF